LPLPPKLSLPPRPRSNFLAPIRDDLVFCGVENVIHRNHRDF
jgi:hypothetical protein